MPNFFSNIYQAALIARISLTPSLRLSLSPIAPGRSSKLHPYLHRADVNEFVQVSQHWLIRALGSIEERHL